MVIGVSIDICLVFLFLCIFILNFVTGLNVSEFNQMYEIQGQPLSDPNACETHRASQGMYTSRVLRVGLLVLSPKTVRNVSVYRPDSLFQEQLGV